MPGFRPDLQELFDEPVLEQVELDPGFEDHGSSVFRVRTTREHVVVRSFRAEHVGGPFWGGLHTLFGIRPLETSEVLAVYGLLAKASPIAVPGVLRTGAAGGRDWLVVELMAGTPLASFDQLSDDGLVDLGRAIATIHRHEFATLGNVSGTLRYEPADFPRRLARFFRAPVDGHPDPTALAPLVDTICAAIAELPPPSRGVPVLVDLFPPQFLHHDGRAVAMVDVDAYVIAPRELDLVCLEYFVDERTAALLARGYREIAPLPRLDGVRSVYRYLLFALTMNPMGLDLDRWVSWPTAFE